MTAPHIRNGQILEVLQPIIENLVDAQLRFQRMSEHVQNGRVKGYFLSESLRRAQFLEDIKTFLQVRTDYDPKQDITICATFHRVCGELNSIYGGGDDALLEMAEQGEGRVNKAYKKALAKELPLPIHQMLAAQFTHIQQSCERITTIRTVGNTHFTL
jgi:uncharacterized protein (TIGR02284 family)